MCDPWMTCLSLFFSIPPFNISSSQSSIFLSFFLLIFNLSVFPPFNLSLFQCLFLLMFHIFHSIVQFHSSSLCHFALYIESVFIITSRLVCDLVTVSNPLSLLSFDRHPCYQSKKHLFFFYRSKKPRMRPRWGETPGWRRRFRFLIFFLKKTTKQTKIQKEKKQTNKKTTHIYTRPTTTRMYDLVLD